MRSSPGISISRVHYPISSLGPGRRIGIWFQGCSLHCPGCISADTWKHHPPTDTVDSLVDGLDAWITECDGVTISGGEPLEQIDACIELLRQLRQKGITDILLFTGKTWDMAEPLLKPAIDCVDAVIAGPYDQEASQTLPLRGSDNQTLHLLSPTGHAVYNKYNTASDKWDRHLDLHVSPDGTVWMAGIPARNEIAMLIHILNVDGTTASSVQSRSGDVND